MCCSRVKCIVQVVNVAGGLEGWEIYQVWSMSVNKGIKAKSTAP